MPHTASVSPTVRPAQRLLAALPAASYQVLAPQLEPVPLRRKQVLYEPDAPIRHVYFPLNAVASLLTLLEEGHAVEAMLVGHQGMVGLPVFLGAASDSCQAIVQVAGEGLRLPVAAFRAAVDQDAALRTLLNAYTQVHISQLAQSSACNRLHPLDERCARWLLQTADAVRGDAFFLTQEFLASMLGVRRSSVTLAAGTLQHAGLITYHRGQITVCDRRGLEDASCACYRVLKALADRLLPSDGHEQRG
jgi:CRP-like cAMP-binding protein